MWQPIETAPKGDIIDVLAEGRYRYTDVQWEKPDWPPPRSSPRWCHFDGECGWMEISNVTHWMPIPAPPSEAL